MSGKGRVGMTIGAFGVLLVALLLGAAGQLLLKSSLNAYKAVHGEELQGVGMLLRAMCTPGVILGLACYVVSTMLYLTLMWKIDVSLLYPMVALNYVFVTVLAAAFLKEPVPLIRILGLTLIIGGVTVYAVWGQPAPAGDRAPASRVAPTESGA